MYVALSTTCWIQRDVYAVVETLKVTLACLSDSDIDY